MGGAPLAEHGVGRSALSSSCFGSSTARAESRRCARVKRALDPTWKLSPGVLFPESEDTKGAQASAWTSFVASRTTHLTAVQRSRLTAVAASPAISSHKAATTPETAAIDFHREAAGQRRADLALRHEGGAQGAEQQHPSEHQHDFGPEGVAPASPPATIATETIHPTIAAPASRRSRPAHGRLPDGEARRAAPPLRAGAPPPTGRAPFPAGHGRDRTPPSARRPPRSSAAPRFGRRGPAPVMTRESEWRPADAANRP